MYDIAIEHSWLLLLRILAPPARWCHHLACDLPHARLLNAPNPPGLSTTTFGGALIMATSVDAKLLRATKFPPEFNQKVDMQKVNVEVMKKFV
jgi:hypothetical protein